VPYLFAQAPRDDVWLAAQAREVLASTPSPPLDRRSLLHLTQAHGVDLATACFDQALRLHDANRAFIERVDAAPTTAPLPGADNLCLVVIPGLFYQERPELGAGGAHFVEIARRCGLDARLIPTRSLTLIEHNTALICASLEAAAATGRAVWVLSISKGALDLKAALWALAAANSPALPQITGWINVCGVTSGSAFADILLRSLWMRWLARLSLWPRRSSLRIIRELCPDHPYARPYSPPSTMTVINVCAVPLASHLRQDVYRRYAALAPLGPNDGLSLLGGSLVLPGLVYPVWGCDHYLRAPSLSALIYKLLSSLPWATSHPHRVQPANP
jgi:hypothetical protein